MVEVNVAYTHDRYENNWSKSQSVVSNVKIFAMPR